MHLHTLISFLEVGFRIVTSATALHRRDIESNVIWERNGDENLLDYIAVRPSGTILATSTGGPHIWHIDPMAHTGSRAFEVPGFDETNGITETEKDVYIFGALTTAGSYSIWRLDLSGHDDRTAVPEKIADLEETWSVIPESRLRMARWDDTRVLVCGPQDPETGRKVHALYMLDTATADFSVAFEFDGVEHNGLGSEWSEVLDILVHGRSVYIVGGTEGDLYRFDVDDDARIREGTKPERLTDDARLWAADIRDDGTVYATVRRQFAEASYFNLVMIGKDGGIEEIAHEIGVASSVKLGRTRRDRSTLYMATRNWDEHVTQVVAMELD